jgi:CRP/FNR family cyclic AMP-dependent transcriptional regulator
MESVEQALRAHPYISDLASHQLTLLEDGAKIRRVSAGQFVFREGQSADCWYLIVSGSVILEMESETQGPVPVQTLGAGESLGCSWLLPPHRWRFDARTKSETTLITLEANTLRRLLREDHELGYQLFTRIVKTVFGRLEATRFQLAGITEERAKQD